MVTVEKKVKDVAPVPCCFHVEDEPRGSLCWERFMSEEKWRKEKGGGKGLGLAGVDG